MTNEELLDLALRALDDVDARVVLADAILAYEWYDERVITVVLLPVQSLSGRVTRDERAERRGMKARLRAEGREAFYRLVAEKTSASLVRAVVAVLLFGGWRTRPWLVWYRHRRDGTSEHIEHEAFERALRESVRHRVTSPGGGDVGVGDLFRQDE